MTSKIGKISFDRLQSARHWVFLTIFAIVSVGMAGAADLSFKLTVFEMKIDDRKSVEIDIVNRPEDRADPNAIPSRLVIVYKFTTTTDDGGSNFIETGLSAREADMIGVYNYENGLSLFGECIRSVNENGKWMVTFQADLRNLGKDQSRISMTVREYSMLVNAINSAVIIKEAYSDNWKKIARAWQRSLVKLDVSNRVKARPPANDPDNGKGRANKEGK